jgi:hypothetical protein
MLTGKLLVTWIIVLTFMSILVCLRHRHPAKGNGNNANRYLNCFIHPSSPCVKCSVIAVMENYREVKLNRT